MSNKNKNANDQDNSKQDEKKNESLVERTSFFEWVVAVIGLVLVLFSISFIAYEGITSKDAPPDLLVKVTSVKSLSSGYLVEFLVKNEGERTAATVVIEGKLSDGDKEIETKTTTIDYIASKSEHTGGLFFTENPEQSNLEIKAVGYENP